MHCKNQPYLYTTVYIYFLHYVFFKKEILTTYNTYVWKIYNYNPQSRVRNSGNETFQWFSSEVWGLQTPKVGSRVLTYAPDLL